MKTGRRGMFGLAAGAAIVPMAAMGAPMVEMHANDVTVVRPDVDIAWWDETATVTLQEWHDMVRRTGFNIDHPWNGLTCDLRPGAVNYVTPAQLRAMTAAFNAEDRDHA